MHDLGIIGGQLYIDGEFIKENLFVKDGRISGISRHAEACADFYDASDKKVIPGLIDPHVHFALGVGGLTSADDFKTGSTAAAYGGITTFIDFLDPVSKAADLRSSLEKRKKLGCSCVDMEAAALFAVAAFRGVQLGQVLLSADDASGENWDPREMLGMKRERERVVQLSIEACKLI